MLSALKFRLLIVTIHSSVLLVVAICGLIIADGHDPWYTFECGA
jgi:hypothetical protein